MSICPKYTSLVALCPAREAQDTYTKTYKGDMEVQAHYRSTHDLTSISTLYLNKRREKFSMSSIKKPFTIYTKLQIKLPQNFPKLSDVNIVRVDNVSESQSREEAITVHKSHSIPEDNYSEMCLNISSNFFFINLWNICGLCFNYYFVELSLRD